MLASLGMQIQVYDRSAKECGYIGCSLSHAVSVAECVHSKYAACAVFEDDFILGNAQAANRAMDEFFLSRPAN